MQGGPPKLIAIDHDDHHAEFIGKLPDGRQFFLTTPFEPAVCDSEGCEYLALFIFAKDGTFLEAKIESFGARAEEDTTLPGNQTSHKQERAVLQKQWLKELGKVKYARIKVAPFSIERFGTQFGLIPREPDDDEDIWAVEMLPGNYMAFFEPWDSGVYDT